MHTDNCYDAGPSITVYCASSEDIDPVYFQAARQLGSEIARRGFAVVNGAGRMGLMRAVSDGALDAGGRAIGVIPRFMVDAGRNYDRLTHTVITPDMAARKQCMARLGCGVIALPGGVGTLEELAEVMTLRKLGLYGGEAVILNVNHYYDCLIAMLQTARDQGFSYGPQCYTVAETPAQAVDCIIRSLNTDKHPL